MVNIFNLDRLCCVYRACTEQRERREEGDKNLNFKNIYRDLENSTETKITLRMRNVV